MSEQARARVAARAPGAGWMSEQARARVAAIFEAYPALRRGLAYQPLGCWPTPVEPLDALARALDIGALWIKREGLSDAPYAGNKLRKLEFVLGEALARGRRRVWTAGGVGSHHCLATAIHGRALGLEVEVVHVPQPITTEVVEHLRALASTGATMRLLPHARALTADMLKARAAEAFTRGPRRPCVIPIGGSSALGVLADCSAAFELAAQVAAGALPAPDRIYVAAGSGGTAAGLWLGCALAGLEAEVIAVRVVERALCNEALIRAQAARAALRLRRAGWRRGGLTRALARPLRMLHTAFGDTYGQATPAARAACELMTRHRGPTLEATYTGKALAGLIDEARGGQLRDATVLFWNTFNERPIHDLVAATRTVDLPPAYQALLAAA